VTQQLLQQVAQLTQEVEQLNERNQQLTQRIQQLADDRIPQSELDRNRFQSQQHTTKDQLHLLSEQQQQQIQQLEREYTNQLARKKKDPIHLPVQSLLNTQISMQSNKNKIKAKQNGYKGRRDQEHMLDPSQHYSIVCIDNIFPRRHTKKIQPQPIEK